MAIRFVLDLVAIPVMAKARRFDLIVTLANFGPVWTASPHAVFQRNAVYYSPEYLERVTAVQRAATVIRRRLTVAMMRRASLVITPSWAMADLIRQQCREVANVPFQALPHGVDLEEFSSISDCPPRGATDPFTFLYPTKPEVYKGLEVLLDATQLLRKSRRNFRVLVTAREDGWPRQIATAIEAARLRGDLEHVEFIGAKSHTAMAALYRSVDAMIYPSLCESFGFPLVEAMAGGTPIVAADLEVNREICGDAALYYAAKDPERCAEAMRRLLEQAHLSEQLARSARERLASGKWTWEQNAIRFHELCAMAIEGRRR
jgi:glycosyltransferase involved in cell wall biosynthesis